MPIDKHLVGRGRGGVAPDVSGYNYCNINYAVVCIYIYIVIVPIIERW